MTNLMERLCLFKKALLSFLDRVPLRHLFSVQDQGKPMTQAQDREISLSASTLLFLCGARLAKALPFRRTPTHHTNAPQHNTTTQHTLHSSMKSTSSSYFSLFPSSLSIITTDDFVDAAVRCIPSTVRAFLDNPATARQINVLDSQGRHAAEEAAREGHVYVLELLLQGQAVPAPYHVHQAFHLAASGGHAEAVLFLLTQQAVNIDANVLNADHQTALHLAAQCGHHKVLKVLLDKATPDPYVREATAGKTPAEMAQDAGADDCVVMLKKYEPIWRRHVLQLLIRAVTGKEKEGSGVADQKCRLAQIPFALVHSHVLEALAGREGGRKGGKEAGSTSMDESDVDDDNLESDDEEDFPQVLSQEAKRRKVGGGGGGGGGVGMIEQEEEEDGEEEDYVYKGMLPSSQDSNDSCSSSSSGSASGGGERGRGGGGEGRASSRKSWVAMKERPLPSRSFYGEPME